MVQDGRQTKGSTHSAISYSPSDTEPINSSPATANPRVSLSATLEQAELTTMPWLSLQNIFSKAEDILSKDNSITLAPGACSGSYIPHIHRSTLPHSARKQAKLRAMTAQGGSRLKMCTCSCSSREVWQTESLWHKAKAKPNMTCFVTCDTQAGVGKKGNRPATSRRRGGRNGKPPSQTVSRFQRKPVDNLDGPEEIHEASDEIREPRPRDVPSSPAETRPKPCNGLFEVTFLQNCPACSSVNMFWVWTNVEAKWHYRSAAIWLGHCF